MPTLSLGGQTLATQTGSDAPVLGSVTLNSTQSFPAGHVIQTVQAIKNDSEILPANTSENIISNWTLIVTPQKASSKILVCYQFDTGWSSTLTARSFMQRSVDSGSTFAKLTGAMGSDPGGSLGDPSLSHAGVQTSWMLERQSGFYLDSPSYSLGNSVQYQIGCASEASSPGIHIGQTNRDNSAYHPRTASVMIGMEIAT
tara:strand:- start:216 stop:815 length:600 start_codon:yes stop_codon:yes gene_type:complete